LNVGYSTTQVEMHPVSHPVCDRRFPRIDRLHAVNFG